jgi:pilus assembly protein CpaE
MLDVQPRTSLAAISPAALRQIDRESFGYYLVTHADSSLRLMAGTLRPEESELVSAEHVRALIEVLKRQFVHVILDVSSRFSDAVLAAFELADQVLMVCTPDAAAVHDVRQCQRVLDELLHFPRGRIQYVLNQVSPYRSISPENVVQLLGAEFVAEVPFGGEEPARAALEGRPLVMKQPGNPASKAIKGLAQRVDRAAREALALAPQA